MFFINSDTKDIILTQGNSAEIDTTPFISDSINPYTLLDGDKIVFTVKDKYNGKVLIQKIATKDNYDTEGNILIKLSPEETNLFPFKYIYDVFFINQNGDVYTYINCSIFEIVKAVGLKSDLGWLKWLY